MKIAVLFGSFNPLTNARQFRTIMEEPEFKNKFKLLVFAILERPRRPQGYDGHFAPFYHEFGTYSVEYSVYTRRGPRSSPNRMKV